jgi:lipopolysaccharide transport system permease protein
LSTSIAEVPWTENRPTVGTRLPDLRELVRFRELVLVLAARDLRVRYAQAQLGALWAILQPLIGMVAFTLVFDRLAQVPSDGIPYPLFAYLGLTVWTYVSKTMTSATQSLADNLALVTKVYIPRLIPPLSTALPGLVDLGIALLIALPFALLVGADLGWASLTLPLWLVPVVGSGLGVGLLLCTLNVRYRDVRHLLGLLVQVGLFVSPIAYPTSAVPDVWRPVYAINPVVAPVEGIRFALGGGPFPEMSVLVPSLVGNATLLVVALLVFARVERRFADVI